MCKRLQESCEEMGCEALVVGGYVVVPVLREIDCITTMMAVCLVRGREIM